jgi:hypothetical protein
VLSDQLYERLASLSYSHAVRQKPHRSPNSPRPAGRRLNSKGPRPAGRGPPVGLKAKSKKASKQEQEQRRACDFSTIVRDVGEPNAVERERMLGYHAHDTAAPGVSEIERRTVLGKCMDANAIFGL